MINLVEKSKNYPISTMYIVAIWVLCFMDVPETPLSNVSMMDKWTHIAMYLGTCLTIWLEYKRNHKDASPSWTRLAAWAWMAPIVMSGIIELGQAYCTGGRRSGEWMDFFANALGCTMAAVAGIVYFKMTARKKQ